MEYILEELLRQRKALAALMIGEMPEEQEDRDPKTGNAPERAFSRQTKWTGTMENGRDQAGGVSEAFAAQRTGWTELAENGWGRTTDRDVYGMLPDVALMRVMEKGGTAALLHRAGDGGDGAAAPVYQKNNGGTDRQLIQPALEAQELPWSARLFTETEAAEAALGQTAVRWSRGTAEMDARALSRAVQRDARRYDGGFNTH